MMTTDDRKLKIFACCLVGALLPLAGRAIDFKPKALVSSVEMAESLTMTPEGNTVLDFGRDGFGWLEINASATGSCLLVYGEWLNGGHVERFPGMYVRAGAAKWNIERTGWQRVPFPADIRNSFPCRQGTPINPDEFGIVAPFRAVEVFRAPFPVAKDSFRRMRVAYPLDLDGSSFACDDERLVRVWDFCKYSLWSTSFTGQMIDGDRERIPYEADAYSTQMALYGICTDYAYARKSIEYLYEHATWPTEFRQASIMSAWADWMYTGDVTSLAKWYEVLRDEKLLRWFARSSDGLLVTGRRLQGWTRQGQPFMDIADWPVSERDGFVFRDVNAVVNAFYYRNLREMHDIASALGKSADAAEFAAEADRVRESYNQCFFDPAHGLYVDGVGTYHSSIHVNAAALSFGLVPAERRRHVADWLATRGMACSVYFANYLLDALFENGHELEAIGLMTASDNRSWLGMLEQGATMTTESWNIDVKENEDWNHAWAASPAGFIARVICGVRPLEPGFAKVSVRPRLGNLKWVKAKIPTARGPVNVDYRGGRLKLVLPAPGVVEFKGVRKEVPAGETEL